MQVDYSFLRRSNVLNVVSQAQNEQPSRLTFCVEKFAKIVHRLQKIAKKIFRWVATATVAAMRKNGKHQQRGKSQANKMRFFMKTARKKKNYLIFWPKNMRRNETNASPASIERIRCRLCSHMPCLLMRAILLIRPYMTLSCVGSFFSLLPFYYTWSWIFYFWINVVVGVSEAA